LNVSTGYLSERLRKRRTDSQAFAWEKVGKKRTFAA
jgi:hypothetical protein